DRLVGLRLEAPDWRYSSDSSVVGYFDALQSRLASLPGVSSVGATDRVPVLGSEATVSVDIPGRPVAKPADRASAVPVTVTPGFFAAARIPLKAGRGFREQDDGAAIQVAIVNAEMARRYWGDPARAIGGELTIAPETRPVHVIGVAADVKRGDLVGSNPQ